MSSRRRLGKKVIKSFLPILLVLVAALAASEFGDEALKFVWRLAAATFVLLVMLRVTRDDNRRQNIVWALALGAGARRM